MNTHRLAFICALALVSLTMGGCLGGPRTLAYKSVEIQELERYTKELEEALARKNTEIVTKIFEHGGGVGEALGEGTTSHTGPQALYITIENSVLFRPGSNDLSANAKAVLARVVAVIDQKYKGAYVRVDGHTDNQPIKRSKDKWSDNWDLAGGRSMKVLHYLLDRGIPANKLSFAGYADQRPVDANAGDAGRAKNRRVEIVVSMGSDVVNEK